jgi:hypothetical protein
MEAGRIVKKYNFEGSLKVGEHFVIKPASASVRTN